jgi:tetratricopeptide (TPR) repeat protein
MPRTVLHRRTRCRLLTILALACLVPMATSALAQEPSPAVRTEAMAKYKQGSQAYAEHRYKDAIDLFLDADALVGENAALAYNTALAYEAMGDDANALRWAREYLRRSPQAADREAVQRTIDAQEARLQAKGIQQLTVLSQPSGATVMVDRRPVGVTPWTGELRPGEHSLALRLEGHAAAERSFQLPASDAIEIRVSLSPVAATRQSDRSRGLVIGGSIGLGVALAAFGTAVGLEVARNAEEEQAKQTPLQLDSLAHLETMEDLQLGSRVAAGIGGALATAGGTMLIVGLVSDGGEAAPPITAGCGPNGCVFTVTGAF